MASVSRARTRGAAAATVAAALSAMTFATCLTTAEAWAADRACCAAMQQGCADLAMESGCCAVPTVPGPAVVPSSPATVHPLVGLRAATLPCIERSPSERQGQVKPDTAAFSPPGVPTYLLVSLFRL